MHVSMHVAQLHIDQRHGKAVRMMNSAGIQLNSTPVLVQEGL